MRGGGLAALIALTLAGCAGGPALLSDAPSAVATTAETSELAMTGRWILSAPNAPSCGMSFNAKPGIDSGTIVPEGGCPERFFLSRRWTLGKDGLTIADDDNNPLATLSYAADHFDGKSVAETPVTLAR